MRFKGIIATLEKADQRRPQSRQLSDKLWVCGRWAFQESKSNASRWWIFMDINSWVHNKVDLEIIGFSLTIEAIGLNDMIQGWIPKTELWYIFLFIVIISLKNIKVLHYKYYRDCFIMGPGRQFLHTLGEKALFRKMRIGLLKHTFFKPGHVNLLLIIDFFEPWHEVVSRGCHYWVKTWIQLGF